MSGVTGDGLVGSSLTHRNSRPGLLVKRDTPSTSPAKGSMSHLKLLIRSYPEFPWPIHFSDFRTQAYRRVYLASPRPRRVTDAFYDTQHPEWAQHRSGRARRNRDTEVGKQAQSSDEEEYQPSRPAKASKKKATKSAKSAKFKKTAAASGSGSGPNPLKMYTLILPDLDKGVDELDKKSKAMNPNSWGITTCSYADSVCELLRPAKMPVDLNSYLGFNLLLTCSMVDASYTDLDANAKMCGVDCDNSSPTFLLLDEALLPLIKAREKPITEKDELPEVPKRWTREDADVASLRLGGRTSSNAT
ncbi:hypothetical protein CDD83_1766 [Cordyceps sp. RAO-2017]|nr:hypothetical protein CDD83_1766 [Cordyceps sp. RAO-2017]